MVDYSVALTNTTGAFPDIEAVNVSAPGAGDGTEFVAVLVQDVWGRAQALMDFAGLTPDGVQEAPDTAQILDALFHGMSIGPGIGIDYWKNDTPAAKGDRCLLLQGQVILIASYPLLVAETYCGNANNGTAPAFFKTSDAGGTIRDTAGTYFVLPDHRGLVPIMLGTATISGRTKAGPTSLGQVQEDQMQGWQAGATADATGARNTWGFARTRDTILNESGFVGFTAWDLNTSVQGDPAMVKAMNDGTNGDPRTGLYTRPNVIGHNYAIGY